MKKFHWLMNFQDPASPFFFNLLSVHHDVIWYMLIMLVFVYWCLVQMIRDFGWNMFNKKKGLFSIFFYFSNLIDIQSGLGFLWVKCAIYFHDNWYMFCLGCRKFYRRVLNTTLLKIMVGKKVFSGTNKSKHILVNYFSYENIQKNVIDQNVHSWLYGVTCSAMYFYDFGTLMSTIKKFKHSFNLELMWAFFPTMMMVLILAPSLYLLYSLDEEMDPVLTVKVNGHQWYWNYELQSFAPIYGDNELKYSQMIMFNSWMFDSTIMPSELLKIGSKRLLEVDNPLIVPLNVPMSFLISSSDVLHSWSVPELGIKIDAIPGRLNQFMSVICRTGSLYGQCSELCGVSHGFMPIVLDVMPYDQFVTRFNNENKSNMKATYMALMHEELSRNWGFLRKYLAEKNKSDMKAKYLRLMHEELLRDWVFTSTLYNTWWEKGNENRVLRKALMAGQFDKNFNFIEVLDAEKKRQAKIAASKYAETFDWNSDLMAEHTYEMIEMLENNVCDGTGNTFCTVHEIIGLLELKLASLNEQSLELKQNEK